MPNLYPNLEAEVQSPDSNTANMTEYISVDKALKLVAPFKGEKRDVRISVHRKCRHSIRGN
jgi:hypothetical protein